MPTSLRLGVLTAAFDDQRRLLLSRRADLNLWTLPGGRLDAGESLTDAAAREVEEETGVIVAVTQPIGLYYLAGWQRMNVLFAAQHISGTPHATTDETRGNAFIHPNEIAVRTRREGTRRAVSVQSNQDSIVDDALAPQRPLPRVLSVPPAELHRLRLALGRRYVWNWLRGKPEPRFPLFDVRAVGLVWDETHRRLFTLKHGNGRALPRLRCDGQGAPWEQLSATIHAACGLQVTFSWVGVWQDAARNKIEFVFAANAPATPLFRAGEWTTARNAALPERDADYAARVRPSYATDPVWMLTTASQAQAGDVLQHL
jgi:ADP-ribose pyrophosphatase YjhB (NUDIX family)